MHHPTPAPWPVKAEVGGGSHGIISEVGGDIEDGLDEIAADNQLTESKGQGRGVGHGSSK